MNRLKSKPEDIEIDLKRAACIVVDMQNAFAKPGGMLDLMGIDVSGAVSVIEKQQTLLATARVAGVQVIYLAMTYQDDLSDAGGGDSPNYHKELGLRLMRDNPQHQGKILIDGTWDWQIVDELTPTDGDLLIRKSRYSGFVGTHLDNYLRNRDIRYLFMSGIATNICVESTARDAFFREYWPILIEDAVNHAGPDFCAAATAWNFENIFGWVTDTDSVMSLLRDSH